MRRCFVKKKKNQILGVQLLGLSAFTAVDPGSIPGWGTKILHTVQDGIG